TRSPQIIGDACDRPGIGVFQRMFFPLSTSHSVGAATLSSMPLAAGPRNCGQFAAIEKPPSLNINRRRMVLTRSFLGGAEFGQHAEIFERRGVAFDFAASGDLFEQASHDFSGTGLGQRFGETNV